MGLSFTVLGCAGSYPGPGAACSGYLVQDGTTNVWLDAGNGTMANLQRHIPLDALDAVIVSHEHNDHWADLEGLRVANTYYLNRSGLPVYGPDGLGRHFATQHGASAKAFAWHPIENALVADIGTLRCTFSRTDHPVPTFAVRIEGGGRVLGYSADSGPRWSLGALGPGLDVALCEASFLAEHETPEEQPHMSARQAGTTARLAGVPRLVLTHFPPTLDLDRTRAEAEEAFGAPVELAVEHGRYEV